MSTPIFGPPRRPRPIPPPKIEDVRAAALIEAYLFYENVAASVRP